MVLNIFQFCKISILIILIFSLYNLFKFLIKRQKYSKAIPSLKLRFTNVLGHLSYFPFSHSKTRWNGYSITTYALEFCKSYCYLFKKEHVISAWIGIFPLTILNSPEAVEELLNGTKALEKAVMYKWSHFWLGTGLITSHGKKWKSRRKQLTPAFHFSILKDFLPFVNEKSQQLVKILEKETTKDFTNIMTPLQLCFLDIICQTALGVNINAQENVSSDYVKAVFKVTDALMMRFFNVLSWFDFTYFLTAGRTVKKHVKVLHDFTISILKEKKKKLPNEISEETEKLNHKRKPLIDILLELQTETNDLTEENIREEVDSFTFAGQDSTSLTLIWACYLTGLHKDIQEKAHEEVDAIFGDDRDRHVISEDLKEMKYIERIIKETLRLYPPAPVIARKANRDMVICDYQILENSTLTLFPYMLHRNEDIFPNPEKFDPDRFTPENSKNRHPYAYIPFSAGPRNCIGQKYAMMTMKTIFSFILRHYTLESLDPRDKVLECFNVLLRPAKDVRIKIRSRNICNKE